MKLRESNLQFSIIFLVILSQLHYLNCNINNGFRDFNSRKERSPSFDLNKNQTTDNTGLRKTSFTLDDSYDSKKANTDKPNYSTSFSPLSTKTFNTDLKHDLSEPNGFLRTISNDHVVSSSNHEDLIKYSGIKNYKPADNSNQVFSRRQRDFSDSPSMSGSEHSEPLNSDDSDNESSSPFSSSGSESSLGSSPDDSNVDSNEEFPSRPITSEPSAGRGSPQESSNGSPSPADDEGPTPYDNFSSSSLDDDKSPRNNNLEDTENQSSALSSFSGGPSRPVSYSSSYMPSPYGLPPSYRSVYPGSVPPTYGFRPPMSNPLAYSLLSSASSMPMIGSYKSMNNDVYSSGSVSTPRYRSYGSTGASGSTYEPSEDANESSSLYNPFSFDSYSSNSDQFGATSNGMNSYNSATSYKASPSTQQLGPMNTLSSNDLMNMNNNWYLNQQYLPMMMKQAGYPIVANAQYNPISQQNSASQDQSSENNTKEKDSKETSSKTKNRLRFNLNRLQAIRLNNLKLPSFLNWARNSTTTTTPSSA